MSQQEQINKLIAEYNLSAKKLKDTLTYNINYVNSRGLSYNNRQTCLNYYINQYNNNLKILTDTLNKNIAIIRSQPTINKKTALLIGINYIGTQYELYGCINDTKSMREFLMNNNKYLDKNITLLTDDNKNQKPTRNNILSQFTNLLKNANFGDTVFLFYSGHGFYTPDMNNDELNFINIDNKNNKYDQMIIPCDFNCIVDDELKNIIDTHLKENVTLIAIFDSCYSETVLDLRYQYLDSLNDNKDTINTNEKETKGNVIMISGCSDIQMSQDTVINDSPCGALTNAFLQTCNKNINISWKQLLCDMREYLKSNSYPQTPNLSSGKPLNIDAKISF